MSVKGEKYTSKKAMKKHEKTEGRKEMIMEYGKVKKVVAKKAVVKKMGKKK
jgi:quinol monooxygenase YgiN